MRNKKTVRIVAIVLALLMVFSIVFVAIDAIVARAAVTQKQIDTLKSQKSELDKKKKEIQSRINTIEYEQMSVLSKKEVLDNRITLTEMEIVSIEELIESYIVLIDEKEMEVIAAQRREQEHLDLYKRQVRDMEENGTISYISIIFEANSFSDLLARIDAVGDIMRADENTYKQLVAAKEATEAAKTALQQAVAEQEDEKVQLQLKSEELVDEIQQATALIIEMDELLETENALYEETTAESEKIQNEINSKVEELRRQEEAKAAAGTSSSIAKGTGTLRWPAPASNVITSPYGTRPHPIFGVYRMHTGIDIGAAYGTNVVAADTGTVITSTYNSSYGNYVVISHGDKTTLYAHMSSRKVKVGDNVTKGDVVGLIGSTGNSTGPHLHFEVSVGGSRVNPLNYFSGYVLRG